MAIAQRRHLKKTQGEVRRESPSPRSSLSFSGAAGGADQVRSLSGMDNLQCDGDLALRNPDLFESMIAQRLLAGDHSSLRLLDAVNATKAAHSHQAMDMASQKLAAVDSLITALKEQEQAEKEITACRQRRSLLAAMLTGKNKADHGYLPRPSLEDLASFQTARRPSSLIGSSNPLLGRRQSTTSILDSVLHFQQQHHHRSSAPPGSLRIPAALASQFT
jgi:hypothetical protein